MFSKSIDHRVRRASQVVVQALEMRRLLSGVTLDQTINDPESAIIFTFDANAGSSTPTASPNGEITLANILASRQQETLGGSRGPVDVSVAKMTVGYQTVVIALGAGSPTSYTYRLDEQGRLETFVRVEAGTENEVTNLLKDVGADVAGTIPESAIISTWIPLDQIGNIGSDARVSVLSLPDYGRNRVELKPTGLQVSDALWHALQASTDEDAKTLGARFDKDGRIQVHVYATKDTLDEVLKSVESSNGVADGSSAESGIIQAWLPRETVSAMSELAGVIQVRLPDYGRTRTGSVNTAGDGLLLANVARSNFSLTGAGVKVGVISDGVDHRGSVGSDLGSVTVDSSRPGSGDEGTAILEIIHDLAPDAQLYFSGPATNFDFVNSVSWLTSQGCDVIIDDKGYYSEAYFTDSAVANAVQGAINNGVTYITAAGNDGVDNNTYSGTAHYQGNFSGTTLHNFNSSGSTDTTMGFQLSPGATITLVLQWSDAWGSSGNDYNLELVSSGGSTLIGSYDVQNGNDFHLRRLPIQILAALL